MPETGTTGTIPDPISLAGDWLFQLDPEGTLTVDTISPDRTIHVPMPWQAAFPELERYSGYAWYQRDFTLGDEGVSANSEKLVK